MSKMQELSKELQQLAKSIEMESARLYAEQSKADKELVDIYHYIEFNNLNAADGFKAYKDLQKCLQYRRNVKNDIELANAIKSTVSTAKSADTVQKAIDTKFYEPRVRTDLFPTPESKTSFSGIICAVGKNKGKYGKEFAFSTADDAVKTIITYRVDKNCNMANTKAKILKAARLGQEYDGWHWSLK